jgi:oxygen-dependent protoporphyrinogen oxidase
LKERGVRVRILEAASRAGGTIASTREAGVLIERGPSSTLATPRLSALAKAVGVEEQMVEARNAGSRRYVVQAGKLVALPSSPPSLITTPLFSAAAKLRLMREPWVKPGSGEESVASFVRRRLGAEILDYAVDPFVAGVYAGEPEQLSVAAAFPKLLEFERKHGSLLRGQIANARQRRKEGGRAMPAMLSFRDGMQVLPDALAQRLDAIEFDSRVVSLSTRDQGFDLVVETRGARRSYSARSLVLAAPAYATAEIVHTLAPGAAAALRGIPYAPVAVVASAYPVRQVSHPLDGYGFLVPRREKRTILGTLFASTLFADRAPSGCVSLTTFVGGMRQPELARRSPTGITRAVQAELETLLGVNGSPSFVRVTQWECAIPQYTMGHLGRVAELEQAERQWPGLYFCANYRGGIAVANCVESAYATAERAAGHLAAGRA